MKRLKSHGLVLGLLIAAGAVQADHNSVWGEGWASMPNDIHNTRIDTMDDDTDSFIDFVRTGSGAETDNRFLSDGAGSDSTGGSGGGAGGQGGGSRGGRS